MNVSISKSILQYKVQLMGLATCLIVWFHTLWNVEFLPIKFIKEISDIGVDLFILLSGYGCTYSLLKSFKIKQFFLKRIVRIIPAYLVVIILWKLTHYYLNENSSFFSILYDVCFLNFFIDGDLFWWYIPVILCYYLILPFYIKIISKYPIFKLTPFVIALVSVVLIISNFRFPYEFLWQRFPLFLIGANLMFDSQKEEVKNGRWLLIVALLAFLACYYVLEIDTSYVSLKYIFYIPIVLVLVQAISFFKISFLSVWGIYSLEMYLIHARFQWFLSHVIDQALVLMLVSIFTSILASILLRKAIGYLKIDRLFVS